jgi:hypothetical protein
MKDEKLYIYIYIYIYRERERERERESYLLIFFYERFSKYDCYHSSSLHKFLQ